jgi:hypothetical protein
VQVVSCKCPRAHWNSICLIRRAVAAHKHTGMRPWRSISSIRVAGFRPTRSLSYYQCLSRYLVFGLRGIGQSCRRFGGTRCFHLLDELCVVRERSCHSRIGFRFNRPVGWKGADQMYTRCHLPVHCPYWLRPGAGLLPPLPSSPSVGVLEKTERKRQIQRKIICLSVCSLFIRITCPGAGIAQSV